ncbi:MAG: glycosyltransferase family 4 protein [Acaryochloridaceae cyanobacterium RL_2_7]|nr:glycosyltransferase family 4 protein [Acaryochloridaceae cyanobacterium RL_2_7]
MRIAQVAPLWERVPPPGYGGIELVVGYLCDELTKRNHDVTLFASGDSITQAELISVVPEAIRLNPDIKEHNIYDLVQLKHVQDLAHEFDLIHFHNGYNALFTASAIKTPVVHTLHGRFTPDNRNLFQAYRDQAFISISNNQRSGLDLNYLATVYNGIDPGNYPFLSELTAEPYLAFLGRLSPEKGPQNAIKIAKATGWKLIMAGKVDATDTQFYAEEVEPHIDGEQIIYLGEVSHSEKIDLISNAATTLFPITWPEPFGLVMIESMCTGTPVLGMKIGSVPEVIQDGISGYACADVEEMIDRIPDVTKLSRTRCHQYVLDNFTIEKMVDGYEAAFQKLVGKKTIPFKLAS